MVVNGKSPVRNGAPNDVVRILQTRLLSPLTNADLFGICVRLLALSRILSRISRKNRTRCVTRLPVRHQVAY